MEHSPNSTPHTSPPVWVYYVVYIVLLILLVLTVVAARLELGAWSTTVALTIATVKAVLVLLYFMHLRYSSWLTWLFAAAGFVWLLILLGYALTDYLSRTWVGSF